LSEFGSICILLLYITGFAIRLNQEAFAEIFLAGAEKPRIPDLQEIA